MNTVTRRAAWFTTTAAATLLLLPAGQASARPDVPDPAVHPTQVEIPASVQIDNTGTNDTNTEALRTAVAVAVGAAIAAGTGACMRRRHRTPDATTRTIDITGTSNP
jgi:hypothetical protein